MQNQVKPLLLSNMNEWEWYHIYHWIMSLNNAKFLKYHQSLAQGLNSENIKGSNLNDLNQKDWVKLGIDDENDIKMIMDEIEMLSEENKRDKTLQKKQNKNISQNQTNNIILNNMYIPSFHINVHENEYYNLYVYAQKAAQMLLIESNKRMLAEKALIALKKQSNETQKVLQDALVKCYNQHTFMAINYAKLQNINEIQQKQIQITSETMNEMEINYKTKCDEMEIEMDLYNKLKIQHKELQQRYNEMVHKLQSKNKDLQNKYDGLKHKMDELSNFKRWDVNHVYKWMININNGYFEKYEELYERLEIQNIDGMRLIYFDINDMNLIGIDDVMDQRKLLANIRILIRNGNHIKNEKEEEEEEEEVDYYGNIDLFE